MIWGNKLNQQDLLLGGERLEFLVSGEHDVFLLGVLWGVESNEEVVQPDSNDSSDEWSDDWHPEPFAEIIQFPYFN